MENLKNKLSVQLQEFKAAYLAKTKVWAQQEHQRMVAMSKWSEEQWCNYLGCTPRIVEKDPERPWLLTGTFFPKNFYNTYQSRTYYNLVRKASGIARMSCENFVRKEEKCAEISFENSLEKLVSRIENKGLNQEKLEVTSSYLDPNLNCTITDGEKTVKAWTIIAQGPIQRPHYRYLVK